MIPRTSTRVLSKKDFYEGVSKLYSKSRTGLLESYINKFKVMTLLNLLNYKRFQAWKMELAAARHAHQSVLNGYPT